MKILNKILNKILLSLFFVFTYSAYSQNSNTQDQGTDPQELKDTLNTSVGQDTKVMENNTTKKHKKAWEVGVGGNVFQINRVYFSNFETLSDGSYSFKTKLRHAVYAADLYIAKELSPSFYIDIQAALGGTKENFGSDDKFRLMAMGGLGLQWRLSPLFKSKYIEPYLRLGVNYIYRDFKVQYNGAAGDSSSVINWTIFNIQNRDGFDRNNLVAVSGGLGVNMWLNDRVGLGLQGAYNYMPQFDKQKNVSDMLQGTARIIFRFGGDSKKDKPQIIEKVVEAPKVPCPELSLQDKEKEVQIKYISNLFEQVYFDFDKADITNDSKSILDKAAEILKQDENLSKNFLITGYTDARGGDQYNIDLSRRRAASVVNYLEEKGVSTSILKSRGLGKITAYQDFEKEDELRRGDRKVTIEVVGLKEYWDSLPKSY